MKDCAIVNVIVDALEEYENNLNHKDKYSRKPASFYGKGKEKLS